MCGNGVLMEVVAAERLADARAAAARERLLIAARAAARERLRLAAHAGPDPADASGGARLGELVGRLLGRTGRRPLAPPREPAPTRP